MLALNSVLSAGYYLKIVKAMYMDAPNGDVKIAAVPASLAFVLTLTALGTLFLGIVPSAVLQLAQVAAQSLP